MGPVIGAPAEDVELGNSAQIQTEEIKVHTLQSGLADAGDCGLDGFGIVGDLLGGDHLMVVGIGTEQAGCLCLDDLHDLLGGLGGLMEHIGDGGTDDSKQGEQDQQGNKAPQAASAHGNALFFVQGLHGLVHFLLVAGVTVLDVLDLGGQPGHLHGGFLALGGNGMQDQLDQNGKDNQSKTVAVGKLIQPGQQVAEGNGDDV